MRPLLAIFVVTFLRLSTGLEYLIPPNPRCVLEGYYSDVLRCENVNLPGNFSVSMTPANLTSIFLGMGCHPSLYGIYCNVLGETSEPFPSGPSLAHVYFNGFQSEQRGTIKFEVFNRLLANVKSHLTTLFISESKLGTLESKCFRGYSALQILSLTKSGIPHISSEAFLEMGEAGVASTVNSLSLEGNALASFDWGALQPIAATLNTIYLNGQRPVLQKVFRSSVPFKLPAIRLIWAKENNLTTLPEEVMETIPGGEPRPWIGV